jgi:hypothetical protein
VILLVPSQIAARQLQTGRAEPGFIESILRQMKETLVQSYRAIPVCEAHLDLGMPRQRRFYAHVVEGDSAARNEDLGFPVELPSALLVKLLPVLKILVVLAQVAAVASKSVNVNLDDIASSTSALSSFVREFLRSNNCSPSQADNDALMDLSRAPLPSEPLDGEALEQMVRALPKDALHSAELCYYLAGLYKTPIICTDESRKVCQSHFLWLCKPHREAMLRWERGQIRTEQELLEELENGCHRPRHNNTPQPQPPDAGCCSMQ